MSRTTWVYLLTIVASAIGLWAILKLGSTLAAPPDLSGAWQIVPEGSAADPAKNPAVARFGTGMRIDQSGRYLQIHFAGGQVLDLKAVGAPEARPGRPPTLRASNGTWTITFRPEKPQGAPGAPAADAPGQLLVLVEKPETFGFTAVRPAARPGPQ